MPRSKYAAFKKLTLIEEFKRSGISKATFSRGYDIDRTTFNHWLNRYERDGIDGLREARHNNHYPKALKLEAVVTYLSGRYSLNEVALKFGLRSKKQLRDWVSKYNKDKTVTASPSKRQVPIMSRKTTFEERISIVEYVTKDKHSYTETAEYFGVSYQQARSWVLKAQQGGYETLVDNRGSAYTSKMFSRYLDQCEVTRSMSRPGTPYDNARWSVGEMNLSIDGWHDIQCQRPIKN